MILITRQDIRDLYNYICRLEECAYPHYGHSDELQEKGYAVIQKLRRLFFLSK